MNTFRNSIKTEFEAHAENMVNDGIIDLNNRSEWHFHLFNEDYYIIGYYQCTQWLKQHEIDCFKAIGECQQYEIDNFGESSKVYDNSETTVNMLAYVLGEHWLFSEGGEDFILELLESDEDE